ncbi:MAG TPA: NAD(P)H-dependent oxidoreductase [Candidatus Omnitrophota bacterium]|nr:NAD(P)H-dependent oxidoreductase [Candidatus Omnitrophota bacterium]
MKYLVIYAHPNPRSFNHAVKEVVLSKLRGHAEKFEVRNLYELKFDPVLSAGDFILLQQGKTSPDILKEQAYVKESDVLIFIYPVWWYGMPAILKGYIDRVFSHGFAYRITEKGIEGLLKGKKVVIFNTTGGPEEHFREAGYLDALNKTADAGIFGFCGMEVILHQYLYAVPSISQEQRLEMLREVENSRF